MVLWVMTPCSLIAGYQHSEGTDWRKWVFVCLHFCAKFEVQTPLLKKTQVFLGCDNELFGRRLPDVLKDHNACKSSQTTQPATQHHIPEDVKLHISIFLSDLMNKR